MSKSRPVLIAMSTLAGLQVLSAGAALTDVIGAKNAAFFALIIAAAQVGVQFFVQNLVVPVKDVGSYVDAAGEMVTGPAAPPEGQPAAIIVSPDGDGLGADDPTL
jgi:hypothetical protein